MPHSAEPDLSFSDMRSTVAVLTILAGAVLVSLVVAALLHRLASRLGRHSEIVADLAQRGRRPARLTLVLIALLAGLNAAAEQDWTEAAIRVCGIALIAGIAWCVTVLAFVFEDLALARYRMDVVDNRHARRVRTQVTLLRRITVAVISIIAAASMLMTFPSVRVAGASIFASAGVVGIVAGLAAQTSLANVFAGLQLAFTDAIRVDDVVVVEDEWGKIEEITLTYVVVHIWDDRRMILPSTYFTTTPFQNWTRKESAVLGAVELDLDWAVPLEEMRAEMHRVLESTDLWDRRVCVLQVTDAVGDHIRIRVLVSGKDGPTTFDLRCHMREALVLWVQRNHPAALPRTRVEFDASAHLLTGAGEHRAGPDGPDGSDGPADVADMDGWHGPDGWDRANVWEGAGGWNRTEVRARGDGRARTDDVRNGRDGRASRDGRDGRASRNGAHGRSETAVSIRKDDGPARPDGHSAPDSPPIGSGGRIGAQRQPGHDNHDNPDSRAGGRPRQADQQASAAPESRPTEPRDGAEPTPPDAAADARLFSGGSPDAVQRARTFSETGDPQADAPKDTDET